MDTTTFIFEYLRVILTFPTVVGVLGVMFLCMFRAELKSLISRIALLKWGSAELAAPQLPPSVEGNGLRSENEKLPNPTPPQLPAGIAVPPEMLKLLEQAMLAERARAYLWESLPEFLFGPWHAARAGLAGVIASIYYSYCL